jgi:hypothetical protein
MPPLDVLLSGLSAALLLSAALRAELSACAHGLAVRPDWNASRWATLVADLKAIGVGNIILADCVTESKAWYPSKIPGLTHADADVVRSQHRRPAAAQPPAPWPARLAAGCQRHRQPAASRPSSVESASCLHKCPVVRV